MPYGRWKRSFSGGSWPSAKRRRIVKRRTRKIKARRSYKPRRVRRYRGRIRGAHAATAVPTRAPSGYMVWPKIKFMRHRYKCIVKSAARSASGGLKLFFIQNFRANSLYDPNFTAATAIQPTNMTAMTAVYKRYCVLGAVLRARVYGPVETGPLVLLCKLDTNTTNFVETDHYMKYVSDRMVTYGKFHFSDRGSYSQRVKNKFSLRQLYGVRDPSEDDYSAPTTTNPTNPAIWSLWVGRQDCSSTAIEAFDVEITIDYFVKWTQKDDVTSDMTDVVSATTNPESEEKNDGYDAVKEGMKEEGIE